jgi:hypothetical protein
MIRIAITQPAFDAIVATQPLGTVAFDAQMDTSRCSFHQARARRVGG